MAAIALSKPDLLVVDYPPEEARGFAESLERRGIDVIFLVAPTTTDARMREIAAVARGYVSVTPLRIDNTDHDMLSGLKSWKL